MEQRSDFLSRTGIGIDIGCRRIKIVRAKPSKNRIQLVDYGSVDTPRGAVESGNIVDPHRVGQAIAHLTREMKLKNKRAVAAVSGPQVYIRIITMPGMKSHHLRTAVRYEAAAFLPIPITEVVLDIFPLREYRDTQGVKVDLFFTAVRRSQVSRILEVCHQGGLKLQAIDLEPLAIKRVFPNMADTGACGFLHIGAARTSFSVFDEGALVLHRYLPPEGYQRRRIIDGAGDINLLSAEQDRNHQLITNITAELIRSLEYFALQRKKEVKKVIVTGGGSCLPELERFINAEARCEVEIGNPISRLELPKWMKREQTRELRYDYTVALGLAARGNK